MLGFADEEDSVAYGLIGAQRRERWSTALKACASIGALAAVVLLASNGGERARRAIKMMMMTSHVRMPLSALTSCAARRLLSFCVPQAATRKWLPWRLPPLL
jgi:hypothetical protein